MLEAGRYRLVEVLSRGGTGEIWRAEDTTLGRQVAIKLLWDEAALPEARELFRQEAWSAAALIHPHVLAVYDFGEEQGLCYLVMELVHGHSLRVELAERSGPLAVEEACRYVRQAAAGLAAAHSAGVVHRNVKPGNLLLAESGVKVADFVSTRGVGRADAAPTSTGDQLGTSSYLAPEHGMGAPAGPAADVYALGCVLYELLCGQPPFTGEAGAVVSQHIEAAPVPPRRLRPEIPAGVSALVLEMLDKDVTARPTAAQVAERLKAGHRGVAIQGVWSREVPSEPPTVRTAQPSTSGRQPRRTAALLAVSVSVVLGASAALGYVFFGGDAGSPSSRPAPGTPDSSPPESSTPPKREAPRPATSPTMPGQDEDAGPVEGAGTVEDAKEAGEARKKTAEERPESTEEARNRQTEAGEKTAEERKKAAKEREKRRGKGAKRAAEAPAKQGEGAAKNTP
ncbi:protein kinase domain-containing protein [Streptomyces sp. 8N114]|uniref:protein kinase domain-containing protein n=1 Tax=Streptomyces sp. 8N114 TaxID=3457419 RepID=UPI003FD56AA7